MALAREEEIEYANQNGVPIPADLDNPYSIDMNLWGRAIELVFLKSLEYLSRGCFLYD